MLHKKIKEAILSGDEDKIRKIVFEYDISLCYKICGRLPIQIAIECLQYKTIESLIELDAGIDGIDDKGYSVLHTSSFSGDFNGVKTLIGLKANINITGGLFPHVKALHIASSKGNLNIVDILISNKADINSRDSNGYTALHMACENSNKECINNLLQNGADADILDNNYLSPLMISVHKNNIAMDKYECTINIVKLISEYSDINLKNSQGLSAYKIAKLGKNNILTEYLRCYKDSGCFCTIQ